MPPSMRAPSNGVLNYLANANYFEYRKIKAAWAGGQSAKMIAMINAVESKLAVRGRITPDVPSIDIARSARWNKAASAAANKDLAKQKLDSFLGSGALPLKEELDLLAAYIIAKGPPGTKWIPGPLKKIDKAMSKTIDDYDYAWTMNKDLVRGTLVGNTDQDLSLISALMLQTCIDVHGMCLIKKDPQKSIRDGGEMKSGYSGWNFVIQFKDHRAFGVEVQANTADMMYGKMSKKDFCDRVESNYAKFQAKHRFPGGLGHSLYDIQDVARSKTTVEEGDLARELALDYNDACRGQFRSTTLQDLNQRIQQFGRQLTTAKAKELWKHDVDGSGWYEYPFLLVSHDYSFTVQKPGRIRSA